MSLRPPNTTIGPSILIIAVRYHFLCDHVKQGHINFVYLLSYTYDMGRHVDEAIVENEVRVVS